MTRLPPSLLNTPQRAMLEEMKLFGWSLERIELRGEHRNQIHALLHRENGDMLLAIDRAGLLYPA